MEPLKNEEVDAVVSTFDATKIAFAVAAALAGKIENCKQDRNLPSVAVTAADIVEIA